MKRSRTKTAPSSRSATEPRTVSVPEAARILGVSRPGYYRLASEGKVPALKIGKTVRVPIAQLEQFINGKWRPQ